MFPLVLQFLYFLQHLLQEYEKCEIQWEHQYKKFFLSFGKKYYFIKKLSFLTKNPFGNVFQTSGVIGLITVLYQKLEMYFNSWKKYFLVWDFVESQVFIISTLFPCFSAFSLLKLMQLVCLVMEW